MPVNNHWNEEQWMNLNKQICENFGPMLAAKIMETIITTIGGARITIPSIQDIERRERNRKICDVFHGDVQECAARFGVSGSTIRRVIMKQRMIDRTKEEDDSP
jgi:Mor family transcriptional regulator